MTKNVNSTQRRMLVEMRRLFELIERANDRMDNILSEPTPTAESVAAASDEIARLARAIQPAATRLVFLAGNRHMVRVVTDAGLAIANLQRRHQ